MQSSSKPLKTPPPPPEYIDPSGQQEISYSKRKETHVHIH
jgi:hypothetical protein